MAWDVSSFSLKRKTEAIADRSRLYGLSIEALPLIESVVFAGLSLQGTDPARPG